MRQLWLAGALLAALILGLTFLGHGVTGAAGPVATDLTHAAAAAEAGEWETAYRLTRRAAAAWEEADGWLRLVESHQTVGEIAALLDEAGEYAKTREAGAYLAANRRVVRALHAVQASERVTLGNLF